MVSGVNIVTASPGESSSMAALYASGSHRVESEGKDEKDTSRSL